MKICLLSFHCCPHSLIGGDGVGGMNVYIKELGAALAEFPDVRIDVFTRRQSPDRKRIHVLSPSLRVIHLEGGPAKPLDRRDLYDFLPEFIENLVEFMLGEEEPYDLIYSHYWLSGLVGEWIKYRFNLPLAHTYHTLAFLKKQVLREGEHEYRNAAERHLALIADMIISSSREEKDSLTREFEIAADSLRVIYPGVNKDLFCPVPAEELPSCDEAESCLLYVGRIEPVKGLMDIVGAMGILREKAPELFSRVCLKVIGGGRMGQDDFFANEEIRRIRDSLCAQGMENKVQFLGSMPQEDLKRFYSVAEALVVPSLYESFGLVVVEALACGTPVLVSKIGKMQSIVKDGSTGFSFRPNDPASLATCLQYFFAHKDSLWTGEKIRSDVTERFSWGKTAEQTYRAFEELVKNHVKGATTRPPRDETPRPA
jgi:D-inositol-3-phosphate glycosyltransferase